MRGFSGCFPDESRENGRSTLQSVGRMPARGTVMAPLAALAGRAKIRRSLTLARGSDCAAAYPAKLALTSVHEITLLKVTWTPLRADIVSQTAPSCFDSGQERLLDC